MHAPAARPRLVEVAWPHLGTVARRAVGPLVADGGVLVDGRVGGVNDPVARGAELRVDLARLAALATARRTTPPSDVALDVAHADDDVVVVVKPPGMHVAPLGPHREDTLVGALLWRAGARPDQPWTTHRPTPAHRLDRPTSGLLLVALRHGVQARLQAAMAAGLVGREYVATVEGDVRGDHGTIDAPIGRDPTDDRRRAVRGDGAPAVTHWHVTGRAAGRTHLAITLGTGRTHQVRVHLASTGHPVVGDVAYGASTSHPPGPLGPAIALRARRLRLTHPVTGATLDVRAPPSPDDPS